MEHEWLLVQFLARFVFLPETSGVAHGALPTTLWSFFSPQLQARPSLFHKPVTQRSTDSGFSQQQCQGQHQTYVSPSLISQSNYRTKATLGKGLPFGSTRKMRYGPS